MINDFPRKPVRFGAEFDFHRQNLRMAVRDQMRGGNAVRISNLTVGTLSNRDDFIEDSSEGGATVQRFKITSITNNDYLVCRTWDGTTLGGTDVNVAKPYQLRRNPFHNKTISGITYVYTAGNPQRRTLTHAGLTPPNAASEEFITPAYAVDDNILAVEPGGGVTTGGFSSTLAGATWEDINHNGRVWLPPYVVLEVCVNGAARKMVFRAGPTDFA